MWTLIWMQFSFMLTLRSHWNMAYPSSTLMFYKIECWSESEFQYETFYEYEALYESQSACEFLLNHNTYYEF